MSGLTKIRYKDGIRKTYPFRKKLRQMGFVWNGSENAWELETYDPDEIQSLTRFAARKGFKCKVYEPGYVRSADYRKEFFEHNKGLKDKGIYQCAYCGRILRKKEDVSVDHIIPVAAVENAATRKRYKRVLARKGITNINDARNLTASCSRCNLKKSANTGGWIIRGRLGSHPSFWIVIKSLETALLCAAAGILIYILVHTFA